jgi:hypothetical protein
MVRRAGGYGALRYNGRALCVLVMICVSLALAPTAVATASPFTWTGEAVRPSWSAAENWEGGAAPSGSGPFALEFPRLLGCTSTCYDSRNDISGLTVESLSIDDGDRFTLEGEAIALGAGGLTASPASGSSGPAGDIFKLPIVLDAAQTWSIYGRDNVAENGVLLGEGLTGSSSPLTLDIGGEPEVYLASDTEVGSLAIDGMDPSKAGVFNGAVNLLGFQLNSQDGNPVNLNHIFLFGSGTLGPLTTETAELEAGESSYPTGNIETPNARFDSTSEVAFQIADTGTTPGVDYSQPSSQGPIQLDDASLVVIVKPPSPGAACPPLTPRQQYTFVSTTWSLLGVFGNAPEGSEIPITFAEACGTREAQKLRIEYHENGAMQTVTGTVVPAADGLPLPVDEVKVFEDTAPHWVGEQAARSGAEEVAAANAARKAREEAEAKAQVASTMPDAVQVTEVSLAGTGITVQSDGMALVKLDCIGSASCAGKLTLSATSTAKAKQKGSHTITIGTDEFLLASGKTTITHVKLNAAGRKLLANAHQHPAARLEIQKLTPAPERTLITNVHLIQQKTGSKR